MSRENELGRRSPLLPPFAGLGAPRSPTLPAVAQGKGASGPAARAHVRGSCPPTAPIPARFTGAWRRRGLWIDGEEVADPLDVWWLQTPSLFADIRCRRSSVGRDGPGTRDRSLLTTDTAFAGVAEWDGAQMAWHHWLDPAQTPARRLGLAADAGEGTSPVRQEASAPDVGRLERIGEQLLETGSLRSDDRLRTYREAWSHEAALDDGWSAECTPERIAVSIGSFEVVVEDGRPDGPFLAELRHGSGRGWRLEHRLSLP